MNVLPERKFAKSIQGQLLQQSKRPEVANFLRDGTLWVADFVDGHYGHCGPGWPSSLTASLASLGRAFAAER